MKELTWSDFIEAHCPVDGSKCAKGQLIEGLGCENCFNDFTKEYFLKDSDWLLALSIVGAAVTNRERLNAAKDDFSVEAQRAAKKNMQEETILEAALENARQNESGCFSHEPPVVLKCGCRKKSFFSAELVERNKAKRAAMRAARVIEHVNQLSEDTFNELRNIIYGVKPCTLANAASTSNFFSVTTDIRLTPAAIFPCEHCAYEWGKKAFPQGFTVKKLKPDVQLFSESLNEDTD